MNHFLLKSRIAGDYGSKISALYTQVTGIIPNSFKSTHRFYACSTIQAKVKPIQTKWDTKCQRLQMTQKHLQVALMMKT